MIEGCALYFPVETLPLERVFPEGRSDASSGRAPTWFEYESGEGVVRLNLGMEDLDQHLRGFKSYVAGLPGDGAARSEAQRLISQVKLCAGVILPHPIAPESAIFASLLHLIEQFDGFMFVADSIFLPEGSFLVGPMADSDEPDEPVEPPIRPINPEECRHQGDTDGVDPGRIESRESIYRLLATRGFRCSRWLPLYRSDDGTDALRPTDEIAARLLAMYALFLWAGAPEDMASSDRIQAFFDRNGLRDHLTPEERQILDLSRSDANEEHADTIGWRLENMWPLSWILGFDPAPPFYTGQISDEARDRMIFEFLPNLDVSLSEFMAAVEVRPASEVGETEDLFYCTHNAVRSAQLGEPTVPEEFHPVRDGGAIHERRHSLTWALSPGTDWDDTDLST
ncbi:MAG: DUF4272 domain-containing protein [Acidobacteriota bacterium]